MKTLVVFLGLLLIFVSFIIFQGDMAQYQHLQLSLKAAAEEAAAGAALYYDEEAYSLGQMIIDRKDTVSYADYVAARAYEKMGLPPGSSLTAEVTVADDAGGLREKEEGPSVTVELTLETEDLFRLPLLQMSRVQRAARYELHGF